MAIVDLGCILANKSLHRLDRVTLMSNRDRLGADSDIDLASDQPTGHRVSITANLNRAALADADAQDDVVGIESVIWKPVQRSTFLSEPLVPILVSSIDDRLNECHVLLTCDELATATQ